MHWRWILHSYLPTNIPILISCLACGISENVTNTEYSYSYSISLCSNPSLIFFLTAHSHCFVQRVYIRGLTRARHICNTHFLAGTAPKCSFNQSTQGLMAEGSAATPSYAPKIRGLAGQRQSTMFAFRRHLWVNGFFALVHSFLPTRGCI
jgi:hypothetical protein